MTRKIDLITRKEKYLAAYYYIFDGDKNARVTVCLLIGQRSGGIEVAARGVSICSIKDQIDKKQGRRIALSRACFALTFSKKCHGQLNRYRLSKKGLGIVELPFQFKAMQYPVLNIHEQSMLEKIALRTGPELEHPSLQVVNVVVPEESVKWD